MREITSLEAQRVLRLANIFCNRIDEGLGVYVATEDLELVALGLFLVVHVSDHAHQIAEFPRPEIAP